MNLALLRPPEPAPEHEVLTNREVREKPALLKDISDPAPVGRDKDAGCGIDERSSVDSDSSPIGANKAADDVDERGFSRAGLPKERGQPSLRGEPHLQREDAQAMCDIDFDRHSIQILRPTHRAISSDTMRAAMEIAIDTSVRRSAPASPPGTWVNV